MTSTKLFLLAAGALLTGVFASGCQATATTTPAPQTTSAAPDAKDGPHTIHHPPGGPAN